MIGDEVVRHAPERCAGCGVGLRGRPVTRVVRRQVFDLPQPVPLRVTEHQLVAKRCWCGVETLAAAPPGVQAPASYGPRLKAVTVYLQFAQFCSRWRAAQAVTDLFRGADLGGNGVRVRSTSCRWVGWVHHPGD